MSHVRSNSLLQVSQGERATTISTSILEGIGGAGLISTFFWYATVPLAPAISIMTILGISIASVLIALPIAYLTYKKLTHETENLQAELVNELIEQKKNQEKLFFEIMRVRCLYINDYDFQAYFNHTTCADVNHKALIALVNHVYNSCKAQAFFVDLSHAPLLRTSNDEHGGLFARVLQNSYLSSNELFRTEIIDYVKNNIADFNIQLERCFISSSGKPKAISSKNVMYGFLAGLTITGVALGTGWTFASLIVGAGLVASMPLIGWGLFGIACIVMGVSLGVGVALSKQKNTQRSNLKKEFKKHNHDLVSARENINTLYSQRYLELIASTKVYKNNEADIQKKIYKRFFRIKNKQKTMKHILLEAKSKLSKEKNAYNRSTTFSTTRYPLFTKRFKSFPPKSDKMRNLVFKH